MQDIKLQRGQSEFCNEMYPMSDQRGHLFCLRLKADIFCTLAWVKIAEIEILLYYETEPGFDVVMTVIKLQVKYKN